MEPTESLQFAIIERLHAVAETIDAGVAIAAQRVVGNRFRIRLERDLMIGCKLKGSAAGVENPSDFAGGKQRRCPTAKIDGVDGCVALGRRLDFRDERINVARLDRRIEQAAVEIAVVANRGAEGNVDVKPKHSLTLAESGRRGLASLYPAALAPGPHAPLVGLGASRPRKTRSASPRS
jgi:hypothetical protein